MVVVAVEALIVMVQIVCIKHQEMEEVVITVVVVMVLVLVNLHKIVVLCQSIKLMQWMELVVVEGNICFMSLNRMTLII